MEQLAGNARISFEGDLGATRLSELDGRCNETTASLKRGTIWPKLAFVILPLEANSIQSILAALGGTVPNGIEHIQIEKAGKLELGLYDSCHPSAIFFGPGLSAEFLESCRSKGLLARIR